MDNNCVSLTFESQIVFWANNSTDQVIEVQTFMWPPLITYNEELTISGNNCSLLLYRWCGPLLLIVKEFAKRINANVKFPPHVRSLDSFVESLSLLSPETEWPHIFLIPISPLMYMRYLKTFNSKLSRHIGSLEKSSISSVTKKLDHSLFGYFACFDYKINCSILISIIVISLMICLKNGSLQGFFSCFWMYLSVLLSNHSIRIYGHFDRSLAGIWLLVCHLLLSLFSINLWDQLVKNKPIDRINSWDDLCTKPQFKNMPIKALKYLEMDIFVNEDTSPMAQDFKKRMISLDPFEVIFIDNLSAKKFEKFFKGEEVLAVDYGFSHYFKIKFKQIFDFYGLDEGFDYHISESGAGQSPYFITVTPRLNNILVNQLNIIITRLFESGIFEHEMRKSFKPSGFGPDIDTKIDTNSYESGPLNMNQMKSFFISFIYVLNTSFLVTLLELIKITNCYNRFMDVIVSRFRIIFEIIDFRKSYLCKL